MARPDVTEYGAHFGNYIGLIAGDQIVPVLSGQLPDALGFLRPISEEKSTFRYAPGKWTLKESLLHIIDTERIMTYRALRIARADKTPLPGFEQDDYVPPSKAAERTWASLIEEFEAVRTATLCLFRYLPEEAWQQRGTASNTTMTPLALAYVVAGHWTHHENIMRQRYF